MRFLKAIDISENKLNEIGKAVRFCLREREITPYRLAMELSYNNLDNYGLTSW